MSGRGRRWTLGVLLAAVLVGPAAAAELTLAITPQFEQRRLVETWRPIVAELERRTGHSIRLITTLQVSDFEAEFIGGAFDLAYVNPWFALKGAKANAWVPLVRDRVPVRGAVIVRRGGPVRTPGELAGRSFACPSLNALGGCLLVRAELKARFGVEVAAASVKTVSNVLLHVAKGLADGGGIPDRALALAEPEVRDHVEVLHTTRGVPAHPIMAHRRVAPETREELQTALLDLAATEEGRALFAKIPMMEPVSASAEEYAILDTLGLDAWSSTPGAE